MTADDDNGRNDVNANTAALVRCPECDGKGQVLDAPANVLDGHPYWITCEQCGGRGWIEKELR